MQQSNHEGLLPVHIAAQQGHVHILKVTRLTCRHNCDHLHHHCYFYVIKLVTSIAINYGLRRITYFVSHPIFSIGSVREVPITLRKQHLERTSWSILYNYHHNRFNAFSTQARV